jgi:hypothetical protein
MFNVMGTHLELIEIRMPLADVDEIEEMLQNFNTNRSAILQEITMTSLALRSSGHQEYLDRDFLLISVVYFQRKVKR